MCMCGEAHRWEQMMIYKFKEYEPSGILYDHLNLGGENPAGERIGVNSLYFTRGGKPWIGIMGEFHFSRYDRKDWAEELCKMKAGGITIVSTYLFWIYHEETEGEFDFTGNNDIRAFVEECGKEGLDAVIRIGPWAHGECRNGGFPDWLLKKPFPLRDNNQGYLDLVYKWYIAIAEQVQGLYYKDGGNIAAIQLENEFCDNADHLAKLKEIAVECGMIAPLYTVTGWNSTTGARIPVDEVVPVFGGYCDAPWDRGTGKSLPSTHYFFNRMRNDSAIGADLIPQTAGEGWQLPYERYPFATCELGGGLQNTHHRRYIIRGMDIYALSLVKLGCGNNLVGYYMYHGGTNKTGKLSSFQESRATGYANDYSVLSYDFQGPLSEYGEVREQYRLLNMLHLFIQDFQEILAPMEAVDAVVTVKREDTSSLRYGMRTDGKGGFVFVNHYQRLSCLEDVKGAVIDTGHVVFPPVDVCGEMCFFFPFQMELAGKRLEYATAQPLCREGQTWFFVQIPGIDARYKFAGEEEITSPAGRNHVYSGAGIQIVTLSWEEARYLRRLYRKLYIGRECDLYGRNGIICSAGEGDYEYSLWNGSSFEDVAVKREYTAPVLYLEDVEQAPFPLQYPEDIQVGGSRPVAWKKVTVTGNQGFVDIDYVGDSAQLYADGVLAADSYYYGKSWRIPAAMLAGKECYLAISEIRDDFYREFT